MCVCVSSIVNQPHQDPPSTVNILIKTVIVQYSQVRSKLRWAAELKPSDLGVRGSLCNSDFKDRQKNRKSKERSKRGTWKILECVSSCRQPGNFGILFWAVWLSCSQWRPSVLQVLSNSDAIWARCIICDAYCKRSGRGNLKISTDAVCCPNINIRGCRVVEYMIGEIAENATYIALFSGLEFKVFRAWVLGFTGFRVWGFRGLGCFRV